MAVFTYDYRPQREGNVFTPVCHSVHGVGGSLSGRSLSRGGLCQGDPHTVKSGRYASYWNAFLLNIACDARKDMVFETNSDDYFSHCFRLYH